MYILHTSASHSLAVHWIHQDQHPINKISHLIRVHVVILATLIDTVLALVILDWHPDSWPDKWGLFLPEREVVVVLADHNHITIHCRAGDL